jgi:hypothetical protein
VLKERQGNGWAFLVLCFFAETVSLEGLERRRSFLFKQSIELLHRCQRFTQFAPYLACRLAERVQDLFFSGGGGLLLGQDVARQAVHGL